MNDATPQWRSFSSDAPESVTPGSEAASSTKRALPSWLVPSLAALGGLAAGAAVAAAGLLLMASTPASDVVDTVGEPLDLGRPAIAVDVAPGAVDLIVDVAGAVARPGLHRLPLGARVGDAIEAAGGFAPRADLAASSQQLNLALALEDGAKVLVPKLGVDRQSGGGAADDGRIDLNHASQTELESLPGIGPVTAGKIMDAREDQRFRNVRDLRARDLVGESVYDDVKDLVRAG